MMPTTLFGLILFILGLCRGFWGLKPSIKPNQSEIVINAGDTIYFECTHPGKIFFFFPEFNYTDGQKTVSLLQEIGKSEPDGSYKYVFTRRNATATDTGWYGCADHNVTITPEVFNDTEFSWIYFYVSSPDILFVEENLFKTVRRIVGQTAILPCRPTSPNLEVELYSEDTGHKVNIQGDISYDPKFGFKFNSVKMTDSSFFKCVTTLDGVEHESDYNLHVLRNMIVNDPKIDENALKHVIRGQNLHVNCTMHLEQGATYILDWNTPHESPRISKQPYYIRELGESTQEVIRELVIKNVTVEDEGEYECYITTHTDTKSKKTYLKIHDPNKKYINLIPQDATTYYQLHCGAKVTWVIMIDAYPEPEIKWLRPNGEQIFSDQKYVVKTTSLSTSLTIYRLDIMDMGIYQLSSTNDDNIKQTLNFTLEVLAKPLPALKNIEGYYAPGQNAFIQCEVAAFPEPNITWSFRRCPNYPSTENSNLIELESITEEPNSYAFLSTTSMTIDVTGIINCTACNTIGCESAFETIFVSDGNGDFGILEPKEPITEGDRISIVCAASIYNYTNNIKWTKGDKNEVIVNDGGIVVSQEKTSFTYRSILNFYNVRKDDADFYTCHAETADKHIKSMEYILVVNDQSPPIFNNSNLRGRELSIDLGKERYNTIILKCYVNGMPKPYVTWYKDGVSLNSETKDQYVFSNNSQELHIKYLLEKDSGKYSCSAQNRLNKIEDFINIQIKGNLINDI